MILVPATESFAFIKLGGDIVEARFVEIMTVAVRDIDRIDDRDSIDTDCCEGEECYEEVFREQHPCRRRAKGELRGR